MKPTVGRRFDRARRALGVLLLAATLLLVVFLARTPPVPSGRTESRTLASTNAELELLAQQHPQLARRILLPHRSLLGEHIWALEVSQDVARSAWKPALLLLGMHHAREWPSVDLTMEFAVDLLTGAAEDAEIRALLDRSRVLFVPIVNPDGYWVSQNIFKDGKRKNCRSAHGLVPTRAECSDSSTMDLGVDLNRNYGAFWGGSGADVVLSGNNARGGSPFSEPETRNILHLLLTQQVVVLVSNHTRGSLVLRLPSSPDEPLPPDLRIHDSLARLLGNDLRFRSGAWRDIYYEASGLLDQTAYYATATLPFTFELLSGHAEFHPAFRFVASQYAGTGIYFRSSARAAYMRALHAAATPSLHAVINLSAPPNAAITLEKELEIWTSAIIQADGRVEPAHKIPLRVKASLQMPGDSTDIVWHVNPSARPDPLTSAWLSESWRVTCATSYGSEERLVKLQRGDTAAIRFSNCSGS